MVHFQMQIFHLVRNIFYFLVTFLDKISENEVEKLEKILNSNENLLKKNKKSEIDDEITKVY